jgi:hypothetical protein
MMKNALAAERPTDKDQQQQDSKHGVHQRLLAGIRKPDGGAHVECWP